MNEPNLLAGALVILGSAFMLLAGIGLVRMPDLYTRMHTVLARKQVDLEEELKRRMARRLGAGEDAA